MTAVNKQGVTMPIRVITHCNFHVDGVISVRLITPSITSTCNSCGGRLDVVWPNPDTATADSVIMNVCEFRTLTGRNARVLY